ncbi:MAG: class I SAM-dependent methyltransferase [Pseudomonadota bacterium]
MLKHCRICGEPLGEPVLSAPGPSLTSVTTMIDMPTVFHVCGACGHGQSPDLPDLLSFYDNQYQISLVTDDHDQLYEMRDGRPVYRNQHQAAVVEAVAKPKDGALVLDFGAAKAASLRMICENRKDIKPFVFDVSNDYRAHWDEWLPRDAQAAHDTPAAWEGRFDLITAHFVMEHVSDPVALLRRMGSLLADDGRVFFSVPNPLENAGDVLVGEHLSSFTEASLHRLAQAAGMIIERIDSAAIRAAFVVIARRKTADDANADEGAFNILQDVAALERVASDWSGAISRVKTKAADLNGAAAIYGAGFYGCYIRTQLEGVTPVRCFIDSNPHEQGREKLGTPVLAPDALPQDVGTVFVGLNPTIARRVIAEWLASTGRSDLDLVFLAD